MFAMVGTTTGELLTHRGRIVVHGDRAELEWLVPGVRVVQLRGGTPGQVEAIYGRPAMLLSNHPDMATVHWPLRREDFS